MSILDAIGLAAAGGLMYGDLRAALRGRRGVRCAVASAVMCAALACLVADGHGADAAARSVDAVAFLSAFALRMCWWVAELVGGWM